MVRPQTVHIKNVCWDQLRVDIKHPGYRSAMAILSRLGLVLRNQDGEVEVAIHVSENSDYVEAVWRAVSAETGIRLAVEMLRERPTVSGIEIGKKIGNHLSLQWSPASYTRIGNALRRWAEWVIDGEDKGEVPTPKAGRGDDSLGADKQGSLFQ